LRLRAALRGERAGALALLAVAVAIVIVQGHITGVQRPAALGLVAREITRTGLAGLLLFGVCGYGPARLLLPIEWRPYLPLFALPVGAACSTLGLTILGLAHVPMSVSVPVVLAAGAALWIYALARVRPAPLAQPVPSRVVRVLVPLVLGLAVGAVALMPSLRAGFATVQGQNGDAILAVGTANFLDHAPPTAVRPDLPLDRVPIQWRSKLPIYYGLAAVSTLAGQSQIMAFSSLSALVLAMFALGIFLFAVHALRAPPLVGLAAAFLVALDRIVVYVSIHTYYNQLWALFALPFMLLFGWRFLRAPDRGSAVLFGLFTALGLFTYPLLLPFPGVFLAVIAWRERGRARDWVRSVRLPRWAYIIAVAVAIPVVAVLVRGLVEKLVPALDALRPGGDLSGWAGNGVLPYLPVGRFVGVEAGALAIEAVALAALVAAAVVGLRRSSRDAAAGLAVLLGGAIASGVYLRARGQGELFWFKDLGFAGPLALLLAIVGLARLGTSLRLRAVGAAGLVLLTAALFDGAHREIEATYELGSHNVLAIGAWDKRIPAGKTIRIDVPPGAWQLWSWYLLSSHRVSALQPLGGFFPHPPFGRHADYALEMGRGRAPDVITPPVLSNPDFKLYRLRHTPGPDTSSRALVYDVKKITY
jgi:hypothetical protein